MTLSTLAALVGIWLVAISSPGPDIVLVLQESLTRSRRNGLYASLGIMIGTAVWILAAIVGLAAIVRLVADIQIWMQIAGGALLALIGGLGLRAIWRGRALAPDAPTHSAAGELAPTDRAQEARRALLRGLGTNLSNPKAMVFFVAVFTPFFSEGVELVPTLGIVALLMALTLGWFSTVAMVASLPAVTRVLGRAERLLDVGANTLFVLIGLTFVALAVAQLFG